MEQLKLPPNLVSKGDLLKVTRELNALNDFFVGANARTPGTGIQLPKTSNMLEQLASQNGRNLLEEPQRQELYKQLVSLSNQAPNLHISFASEPTPRALEPILVWLRENIHPQVLLSVGFQPIIAAGCVLRTPNKIFDMSMGPHLQKQAPLLMKLLAGSIDGA
jgi:F0F1-type ATP synthase delta subunit